MHYHFEVVIEKDTGIDSQVSAALQPFEDTLWDWWQIGGRWKGEHVAGYDATKDPDNLEPCRHPYVTAQGLPISECKDCDGTEKGLAQAWPSQWKPHRCDIIPVSECRPDLTAAVVIAGGKAYEDEKWDGSAWIAGELKGKTVKQLLEELGIRSGFLVTVDCHN